MSGRYNASWSVDIAAPAEVVFDYLADPNRHAEWSPKSYRVEDVIGVPGEAGMTFTSVGWVPGDSAHRNTVSVSRATRPALLEFSSVDRGETFVNRFELTPNGNGTRVTRSADWPKPSGFVGSIFPVISAVVVTPDVKKGLGKLKSNLENGKA